MKSILITGADGGMGKAATDLFAGSGYRVFALDREECAPRENVIPVKADLTDAKSVEDAFGFISSKAENLCGIIHLAGIYMLDSLVEMPAEDFERAFKINLGGVFLINKTFLPLLEKGSRIIIVTSELAALDPLPFTGIYGITKTALDKYAYSLRMELQLLDIHVSVIRAGAVDTGLLVQSTSQLDRFCSETKLYTCNAARFREIVDRVESRKIPPEKIAKKIMKISGKKHPAFSYSINRNPLLIMLDMLPKRARFHIIRKVLGTPGSDGEKPKQD